MISGGCSRSFALAHERYGRAGDVNHAIKVGIHHRLEPLRAQLLERRDIAVPGVIHDNVETSKCGNRRLHGRLSGAFMCHVKRDRANAVAVFFSKSSSRFVSRAVATSRSPDSNTASAMFRPKPLELPVTNHTLFINSCLSSCTYCLVPDRRSAALDWEGVVPSHVRKAR